MKDAKKKQFLVAGLGLFGQSVAYTLHEMGYDVLGVDYDESIVQNASTYLSYVVCADAADENVLKSLPVDDIDVAVVAIGTLESNMMCTLLLKEMGVPVVVVKALNDIHGTMLKKIGADKIIYPEKDMGKRAAHNLVSSSIVDYIELSSEISVMSLQLPEELIGKDLVQADLRRRFNINVVAIKRGDINIINPNAHEVFQADDEIIIIGTHHGVKMLGGSF